MNNNTIFSCDVPYWCKAGQFAYCTKNNQYVRILEVDPLNIVVMQPISKGEIIICDLQAFNKIFVEARIRFYKAAEMRQLVGKAIRRMGTSVRLVTMYDRTDDTVSVGDGDWLSNEELLSSCTFSDGSPCGVLLHSDDSGEWVQWVE